MGRNVILTVALSTGLLSQAVACGVADEDAPSIEQVALPLCETFPDWDHIGEYFNPHTTTGIGNAFVTSRAPAVGRGYDVDERVAKCSGTLVSRARNLFLTAGHCTLSEGDQITFNRRGNFDDPEEPPVSIGPEEAYPIVRIVDKVFSNELDVAVYELGGNPGAALPETPMRAQDPDVGQWLTLIGHPHLPLMTMADGSSADGLQVVAQGIAGWNTQYGMLQFRANSRPGMSGGGLLNGQGEIVGTASGANCTPTNPNSWNSASSIARARDRWLALGITELSSIVRAPVAQACLTGSLPSAQVRTVTSSTQGFVAATSVNGFGAYGFSGCPYTFVVELSGVLNRAITPQSRVATPPTTESSCLALTHITVIKGFKNSAWHTVLQRRTVPEWDNGICDGRTNATNLAANHGFSRVRVLARVERGQQHSQLGPQLATVTAGAHVY